MAKYILPGSETVVDDLSPTQSSPLLRYYSPRLFGAPPQLTNQCDMRLMSSDGKNPGPVGDFYLTKILQDANIVNFNVGRARFIGGMSTAANIIREAYYYSKALSKYDIYGQNDEPVSGGNNIAASVQDIASQEAYESEYGKGVDEDFEYKNFSDLGLDSDELDAGDQVIDISSLSNLGLEQLSEVAGQGKGKLLASLLTSLSVQQRWN